MTRTLYLALDCESLGLYGPVFAFGWRAFWCDGTLVDEGIEWTEPRPTRDGALASDRAWVEAHVMPHLKARGEPTRANAAALDQAFWFEVYLPLRRQAQTRGATFALVADCGYPVEAGFLRRVVERCCEPSECLELSPWPLHELASLELAAGVDLRARPPRNDLEMPAHDPLCDARRCARLWCEALEKLVGQKE